MPHSTHVFLSYPRADAKKALEIKRILQDNGHTVWQDLTAIKGGKDWIDAITEGIFQSYAVVSVVSAHWKSARWARTEVLEAQRRGKPIIPLLIDNSDIPAEFLTVNVLQFHGSYREATLHSMLDILRTYRDEADESPAESGVLCGAVVENVAGGTLVTEGSPVQTYAGSGHKSSAAGVGQTAGFSAARAAEIDYLDSLTDQYKRWATLYTPLAGLGQSRGMSRADLPGKLSWIDTGFLGDFAADESSEAEIIKQRSYDSILAALDEMRQLALLGYPGSGKTTTMWYVTLQMAQRAAMDSSLPLPVLVGLNMVEPGQKFPDIVKQHLGPLAPDYSRLLAENRIAFLFDGLNELRNREEHAAHLREFVRERVAANNVIVATCRDLDYAGDLDLRMRHRVKIAPLDPLRLRQYIDGYFDYLGQRGLGDRMFWQLAGESAERSWLDFSRHVGDDPRTFWSAVRLSEGRQWGAGNCHWEAWVAQRQHKRSLLTLLSSPYLLLMAIAIFSEVGRIPRDRGLLFHDFVEQLLKERAGVKDSIDRGRLQRKLGRLAYNMICTVGGGTSFELDVAQSYMETDGDLQLARAANILSRETFEVRFVHQLLQEYYAACHLAEDQERLTEFLRSIATADKASGWEDTLVFLGSIYPENLGGINRITTLLIDAQPLLACRMISDSGKEAAVRPSVKQALVSRCRTLARSPDEPVRGRYQIMTELGKLALPLETDADHFISIRGGNFDYLPNRRPVADFFIAKYPVTNREFRTFVNAQGYITERYWQESWEWMRANVPSQAPTYFNDRLRPELNSPDAPVVGLSWYEAEAFCRWKTEILDFDTRRDGWEIRLPLESEWIVAVRGASARFYPWGNASTDLRNRCQFSGSRLPGPAPVGIYPDGESPDGVSDLLGNVYELVVGVSDAFLRACRGGSWQHDADRLMESSPEPITIDERTRNDVGFRYVYAPIGER